MDARFLSILASIRIVVVAAQDVPAHLKSPHGMREKRAQRTGRGQAALSSIHVPPQKSPPGKGKKIRSPARSSARVSSQLKGSFPLA